MRRILYNKAYPSTISEQRIQILSVNDKWCQTVLVVDCGFTDSAGLFSSVLHIPVRNAHVKHILLYYELLQEK